MDCLHINRIELDATSVEVEAVGAVEPSNLRIWRKIWLVVLSNSSDTPLRSNRYALSILLVLVDVHFQRDWIIDFTQNVCLLTHSIVQECRQVVVSTDLLLSILVRDMATFAHEIFLRVS